MAMTAGHSRKTSPTSINAFWDPRIAHEILWTKKTPAVCRRWSCSSGERQRLLPSQVSTHQRQHGRCMQSCNGIPKVWVGVVSLMAIVWTLPRVQIYSKCGFLSEPGLKLLLELPKSNCWQRTWLSNKYVSAKHVAGVWPAWRLGGLPSPRLPVAA